MISVSEATSLVDHHIQSCSVEFVNIEQAYGKILKEDLFADRHQPPFHRVAMDGIAFNSDSFNRGQRKFKIQGVAAAGQEQMILNDLEGSCLEVMTGGVLPKGCDCVVKVEDITIHEGVAELPGSYKISPMLNVHVEGSDHQKGDLILQKNCRLLGPQISVAATVGKKSLKVSSLPKVAIINTGDELVDVNETPLPHQIRRSNAYAIKAELNLLGFEQVDDFHLKDSQQELFDRLNIILKDYDVLILSGGVSMGKFDFIPQVLSDLGIEKIFHKIKQKPGKPMWFGVQKENKKSVFALPGNPVSALICFKKYVVPGLEKMLGCQTRRKVIAKLNSDLTFKKNMVLFQPVKMAFEKGQCFAEPIFMNGSGDYACLAQSHGFVQLDPDEEVHKRGTECEVYLWGEF